MCVFSRFSHVGLCVTLWTVALQAPVHGDSPGKSTGVGCHSLLQGIFLTQELNLGLLHCRQILYHLSYQRNPGPEAVAFEYALQCLGTATML